MGSVSIVFLILVFGYGVFNMKKASSITKDNWFKKLSYENKIQVTTKIKNNWKFSIILLAVNIASILIQISTYMGKVHNYNFAINIITIMTGIIIVVSLTLNNGKLQNEINKFDKEK